MGYIRAEEILPNEIIELIQNYVDGQNIYISKKENNRSEWGNKTGIRQKLIIRDRKIYNDFDRGMKISELADKYFLSEKSIQRIIRKVKNESRDLCI